MAKPIVKFDGIAEIYDAFNVFRQAIVYGVVDHPKLGNESVVTTSGVVKVSIETKNTVYVWEKEDEPKSART